MNRSILFLVSACSLVAVAAVGCAAPTGSSEPDQNGITTEDLGASSAPRSGAVSSAAASSSGVIDPLCIEKKLHADACIFDYEWRVRAEEICAKNDQHLENFEVVTPCAEPGSSVGPATGSSAAAGGDPSSTAASGGIIIREPPSATTVEIACCNGGVGPIIPPRATSASAAAK